ncbi:hypothetical protein HPB47_009534 [Ixodes persulcatus]|uniref:Uncharacterized protein n=1 Tax=Ixodes persulcatus TaxID=34615 RepID=A0AC60P204_IXOPE|nr:hypothetical protein HPB47_009534 [Ixodes persulcatus]
MLQFQYNVIRDAVTYTEHAKRKTVTAMDVVYALKRQGLGAMKQATLFRAWNPKPSTSGTAPRHKVKPPDTSAEDVVVLSDDDDEFLVQAMDQTLASAMPPPAPPPQKALEDLPGFDVVAGQTWIYPTNYPVRDYQFNIVQSCLFKNTMVILPTGLGKTFIAAVVMYNFYRWYPTGKIVFTAPTKPLVAQQIEACYKIMGIPLEDTLEMTGNVPAPRRATAWREKRVFFLTPQVMMNDLLRNALKPQDVKCLVIDEAHKALGNYAYCQVVQEIMKYTNQFRVVALSATPGSDVNAVRQVLSNLMISHVELRSEESIDIQKYTQRRTIDKVVVPLGHEIVEVKRKFLQVVCMYLERLERQGALPRLNPESLGKFRLLKLKEAFLQSPPQGMAPRLVGQLQGDFSLLISLYHAYELLLAHGLRPFFHFLKGIVDGEKSQPRVRYELMHHPGFNELYTDLKERLGVCDNAANETLRPSSTTSSLFEVVKRFRDGGYNVLVSTCVGEEGLDIGEIDLIVCYDAPKSPIRLVQRMGRTGRKRAGRIVVLLSEGKEEQAYRESNSKKQTVHRAILNGGRLGGLYQGAPTMVPRGITPSCHRMFMTVPEYRPAGGSKTALHGGQLPITSLLLAGKRGKEGGVLTRQEQLYYEAHFEVAESAIPTMPTVSTSFVTLRGSTTPESDQTASRRPALSLSSWTPWQNSVQPTLRVSHSRKTDDYVHVMQFIENLRLTDDCMDAYGLEMKTFLRMEDVMSDSEADNRLDDEDDGDVAPRKKGGKKRAGLGSDAPSERRAVLKKGKVLSNKRKDCDVSSVGSDLPSSSFGSDGAASDRHKTKKKKTITDFFKEKPEPDDLSTRASAEETDFVEVVESRDDGRCNIVTLEELFRLSPARECEDWLGRTVDAPRVEVRTPPTLEADVLPGTEGPWSPVDIGKALGRDAPHESDAVLSSCERSLFLLDVADDLNLGSPSGTDAGVGSALTRTVDGELLDACEKAGRSAGTDRALAAGTTRGSRTWSSKLELDSDLEDMLGEDCFEDVSWSCNRTDDMGGDAEPAGESVVEDVAVSKVNSREVQPEIPVMALPRLLDAVSHSTPCKPVPGPSAINVKPRSMAFIASPEVFCGPSPIRNVEAQSKTDTWDLLDDSDAELFQDLSDGQDDVETDKAEDEDDDPENLGMTELCALLDQESTLPNEVALPEISKPVSSNGANSYQSRVQSFPVEVVPPKRLNPVSSGVADLCQSRVQSLPTETAPAPKISRPVSSGVADWCQSRVQSFPTQAAPPEISKAVSSVVAAQCQSRVQPLTPKVVPRGILKPVSSGVPDRCQSRVPSLPTKVAPPEDSKPVSSSRVAHPCQSLIGERDPTKEACPRRSLSSTFATLPVVNHTGETSVRSRPSFELLVDLEDLGFSSDESASAISKKETDHDRPPVLAVGSSRELPPSRGRLSSKQIPVALVKPMVATQERGPVVIVSSEEESPVRVRRKVARRRAVLSDTSSPDSDVPSPSKKVSSKAPKHKAPKRGLESSDDDFQGHEAKGRAQRSLSLRSTVRRDPHCSGEKQRRDLSSRKEKGRSKELVARKERNNVNQFIEREADVSADIVHSSDESENSSLDAMDDSFIDDQTQAPNKSLYLHAMRSPIGVGRFKLSHRAEAHEINVYSQAVSEDEADYICDSFCVRNSDPDCLSEPEDNVEERCITRRRKEKKTRRQERQKHVSISDEDDEDEASVFGTKVNTSSVIDTSDCHIARSTPADDRLQSEDAILPLRIRHPESQRASANAGQSSRSSDLAHDSATISRERRLNLQRLKQDEFRQKHLKEQSLRKGETPSTSARLERLPTGSTSSVSERAEETRSEDVSIFVDSRVIASGPALVSMLRAKRGVDVHVHSLEVGDFLVSQRTCVIRKSWIDFGNSQNQARLVDEVRRLFELYDRPCVILERLQRSKPGERTFKRTKYFDFTLMSLASTHAKVLFSYSQEETADLLLTLAQREQQKGMALASVHCLRDKNEAVQFYLSVPKVSLATALNFAAGFRSIAEFLNSSVERVQEVGKTTRSRAKDIVDFCNTSVVLRGGQVEASCLS